MIPRAYVVPAMQREEDIPFLECQERSGMFPRFVECEECLPPNCSHMVCPILGKLCKAWKRALEYLKGEGGGYIILCHQDTVVEDPGALDDLLGYMRREGIQVCGQSENDGVMRNNFNGSSYVHSSFLIADALAVGEWWDVDDWVQGGGWIKDGKTYALQGTEFYWLISYGRWRDILYLDARFREPPIGKAVSLFWDDRKIASHLWYSTGDSPLRAWWHTLDGHPRHQFTIWKREWFDEYLGRRPSSIPDRVPGEGPRVLSEAGLVGCR